MKQTDTIPVPLNKPAELKELSKSKAKEEPKKATKLTEPKPEAAEEEEAPKPKPKNPLDLLSPSKMVLDDWKRLYSNTKTNFREVAIKGNSCHGCLFHLYLNILMASLFSFLFIIKFPNSFV